VEKRLHNSAASILIQQQMKEVRHGLDEDVKEIAEGVRELGDWRSYVRAYPWICLGAAFAVGYLIVPRRRVQTPSDIKLLTELAKQDRPVETSRLSSTGSIQKMALTFVGDLVVRGISSYVGQHVANFMAAQSDPSQESHENEK
jgi:hypothetical protein